MSHVERLAIVVSLLLLDFMVLILVPLPSQELAFTVLGSELGLRITGAARVALLVAATICVGSGELSRPPWAYRATLWPLPALSGVLGVLLVERLASQGQQIVLASLTIIGVAVVMALQVRQMAAADGRGRALLHIAA